MDTVSVKFLNEPAMKESTGYTGPQFSYVVKTKKKDSFKQVTSWASCRHNVCGAAIQASTGDGYVYSPEQKHIDFDNIRILAYLKHSDRFLKKDRAVADAYMGRALNMLNFFEKMGHIKRTEIYRVDSVTGELSESNFIYMFEGSGEWMRSPHLISLFCLFIRAGKWEEFEGFKTFMGFLKKIRLVVADHKKWSSGKFSSSSRWAHWPFSHTADITYLAKVGPKLAVIMEQRKELFSSKKKKEHFQNASTSADGIANMVYGNIGDNALQKKFVKSCDKYEIDEISE